MKRFLQIVEKEAATKWNYKIFRSM